MEEIEPKLFHLVFGLPKHHHEGTRSIPTFDLPFRLLQDGQKQGHILCTWQIDRQSESMEKSEDLAVVEKQFENGGGDLAMERPGIGYAIPCFARI